jgi:dihydroflavonol-4-reductase
MKVLVTGASGIIGFHLIEELAKQGLALRAAYRPGENFREITSEFLIDGLDVETFALDLTDGRAVAHALQGVQLLFHAEHFISFERKDKGRLYAVNHLGTKTLLETALNSGVEKVVYTSGMETLRAPAGREVATENDGIAFGDLKTDYEKSRYLAEREALTLRHRDLPVVIVHPTVCLGKGDRGVTPFGKYLRRYLEGKARFYLDSGLNLVDVVDVAKGHLLAAKRGEVGKRYILGNQNVYFLELLRQLERLTKIPVPKTALPIGLAKLLSAFSGLILRRKGVPSFVLNRLKKPLFFDASLAVKELGMPQSNVWEALRREIADLRKAS